MWKVEFSFVSGAILCCFSGVPWDASLPVLSCALFLDGLKGLFSAKSSPRSPKKILPVEDSNGVTEEISRLCHSQHSTALQNTEGLRQKENAHTRLPFPPHHLHVYWPSCILLPYIHFLFFHVLIHAFATLHHVVLEYDVPGFALCVILQPCSTLLLSRKKNTYSVQFHLKKARLFI